MVPTPPRPTNKAMWRFLDYLVKQNVTANPWLFLLRDKYNLSDEDASAVMSAWSADRTKKGVFDK